MIRQRHYFNGYRVHPQPELFDRRAAEPPCDRPSRFERLGAVFAGAVLVWAIVVLFT